jgi:hypothetical protein
MLRKTLPYYRQIFRYSLQFIRLAEKYGISFRYSEKIGVVAKPKRMQSEFTENFSRFSDDFS